MFADAAVGMALLQWLRIRGWLYPNMTTDYSIRPNKIRQR